MSMSEESETRRQESIAQTAGYLDGVMRVITPLSFQILRKHIRGSTVLELGPAEGLITEQLVAEGLHVEVIEASRSYSKAIALRQPTVVIHNCLFEDFQSERQYSTIVLGHVLEHVADPVLTLSHISQFLEPNGVIFSAVPNAYSIHRRAAVLMGLLSDPHQLNETDRAIGHRRVFDPDSFLQVFESAGLSVVEWGGYWLKPISNRQLAETWTDSMLNAFFELGTSYPDLAAEIWCTAVTPVVNT
jgi:2-polyprenyl-3-methyl-5-hydroxy-6-metoxy-1,4-benzoquinol methylase